MASLTLHFSGTHTFEAVRDALGEALSALGEPAAPWSVVAERALDDRNGAGLAFERSWRRGTASLVAAARSGEGNPRDGYGYDLSLTLDAPRWSFRWTGGAMEARVSGLRLPIDVTAAQFRAVRSAMAAALGADESDRGFSAVENLRALEGVDRPLQLEILTEALAHSSPRDVTHGELLRWRERLFGADLAERLVGNPADLEAWTQALASPPRGWTVDGIRAVVDRLTAWDLRRPEVPRARAWRWIPALGGDGQPPAGWTQLDDGVSPTWVRPALANQLVRQLDPELAEVAATALGSRAMGDRRVGIATGRAAWRDHDLPRAHVAWTLDAPLTFDPHATVDWIWGDALDDVVVLASRRKPAPPAPVAMYLSGSEAFRARVMRALHDLEPYAWRPVARPLEASPTAPRPRARGTRQEVAALLAALPEVEPAVIEAFDACRCAEPTCEHARAILEARRAQERAQQGSLDRRTRMWADARVRAYAAAAAVRSNRTLAAHSLEQAWRSMARAEAMIDLPERG